MNIQDIVRLSELIGEMGHVKRATQLPNGESESDSHHSFSLALIAYQIVLAECPELDEHKVLVYALAHDLLEIITGDEDTLHFTPYQFAKKHAHELKAYKTFDSIFAKYPDLRRAMYEYERLDTPEAATVFVLDKACTTWTWLHHADFDNHSKVRNITSRADVDAWMNRQSEKFKSRLNAQPPAPILAIYEQSFAAMKDLFDE